MEPDAHLESIAGPARDRGDEGEDIAFSLRELRVALLIDSWVSLD